MAAIKCTADNPCGLLIVEDDSTMQNVLRSYKPEFLEAGLKIEIVATIEDAKFLLAQCIFEVALLDLNLEKTKGVDTLIEFRPLLDCPIFGFTGYYDQALHDVLISHGAEDIFIKTEVSILFLIRLLKWAASQYRTLLFFKVRAEVAENSLRHFRDEAIRTIDETAQLDPIIEGLHQMASTGR
jgi:DNA-binding NtrC family response regulator